MQAFAIYCFICLIFEIMGRGVATKRTEMNHLDSMEKQEAPSNSDQGIPVRMELPIYLDSLSLSRGKFHPQMEFLSRKEGLLYTPTLRSLRKDEQYHFPVFNVATFAPATFPARKKNFIDSSQRLRSYVHTR